MENAQDIYVLNKKVHLLQAVEGFWTSMDSVMLAAACPIEKGQRFLDMGCGVGSAGFCVLYRVPDVMMMGIDIQASHIQLAKENAVLNHMQQRADFICSDIKEYKEEMPYDHVICNPPYMEAGDHLRSPSEEKAKAMGHDRLSLQDWMYIAGKRLRQEGTLTLIHQAGKLDHILQALQGTFGAIDIIPLWPKQGQQAKRVIIRAVKDRKSPAIIHSGLVLHNDDGSYTEEAESILRDGAAIL